MVDLNGWLTDEVGSTGFAIHASTALAANAMAIHLRDVETARHLVTAFPDLALADCTEHRLYNSPMQALAWTSAEILGVCNLYSLTRAQDAIRGIAQVWDDRAGNLPPLPGIYPDQMAPVVWNNDGGRVLSMMRWGMPSPSFALKNRKTDRGVTNVRNTKSPHWRRWLGVGQRCVVPFTAFSEPDNDPARKGKPVWFALGENRPLAFFAGIRTRWTSVRKLKDGETTDDLFAFLTTEPNAEVAAVHPKAMPVILRTEAEIDAWLMYEGDAALAMQQPLPDGALLVVDPEKDA
ncbi:MAG: SOS response-associated peptidase family protein [Jannaschia sp.]